jgi:hypothetical protein
MVLIINKYIVHGVHKQWCQDHCFQWGELQLPVPSPSATPSQLREGPLTQRGPPS